MKAIVIKSTESVNGGYVTTIALQAKDPFGGTITTRRLIKTENAVAEGTETNIDLRNYVEDQYTWTDDEGNQRTSKWLAPKLG
jgi:hypothetical protein